MYLFKISTKVDSVWSAAKPKAIYIVAESKEGAANWISCYLQDGLKISKVTKLGMQLSDRVYVSS